MRVAVKNQIICNKCEDLIESKHIHDFVWCSCGSCAVDGGLSYLKRCGNLEDWTDATVYREATREEKEAFIKLNINEYLATLRDVDINLVVEAIEEYYND